jgi:hypothetical protein
MWSTGNFIKPLKANGISPEGFTVAWAERTALYSTDIQALRPKTWKKIMKAALNIVEKKGAPGSVVPATKVSRRRQIIDADESD